MPTFSMMRKGKPLIQSLNISRTKCTSFVQKSRNESGNFAHFSHFFDFKNLTLDTTKALILQGFEMVLGDGIEPPTRGFSVP